MVGNPTGVSQFENRPVLIHQDVQDLDDDDDGKNGTMGEKPTQKNLASFEVVAERFDFEKQFMSLI